MRKSKKYRFLSGYYCWFELLPLIMWKFIKTQIICHSSKVQAILIDLWFLGGIIEQQKQIEKSIYFLQQKFNKNKFK